LHWTIFGYADTAVGILSWDFHFRGLEIDHEIDLVIDLMTLHSYMYFMCFGQLCELIRLTLSNIRSSI
jgi:hypothetical protein